MQMPRAARHGRRRRRLQPPGSELLAGTGRPGQPEGSTLACGRLPVAADTNTRPQANSRLILAAIDDINTMSLTTLLSAQLYNAKVISRAKVISIFINLKKLKSSLSPSQQWPQAALRLRGDGRQVP